MTNPYLKKDSDSSNDSEGSSEKDRRSTRHEYRGQCTLATASQSCTAHLINLSENGALIAVLDEHNLSIGERIRLNVVQGGGLNISVRGRIVHLKEHFSGLEFSPETKEDQELLKMFLIKAGLVPDPDSDETQQS